MPIVIGFAAYLVILIYAVHAGERGRRIVRAASALVAVLAIIGAITFLTLDVDPLWLILVAFVFFACLTLWAITGPLRAPSDEPAQDGPDNERPSGRGMSGPIGFMTGYILGRKRRE